MLSWDDLAAGALARQFPDDPGTVAERVHAIGDMQTQTARSAFIGLAARFPGVTHAEITAAYDAGEIVRGKATSKETIATTMDLARRIRKVGVLVGNCDGFVGNRMLAPYLREAEFLVEEGATPRQVDKVIYDFGLPMGPFAMGDMAGLDVGWRIRKGKEGARNRRLRYSPVADRICEMGRFGQKTGSGYYRYSRQPGGVTGQHHDPAQPGGAVR